MKKTSLICIILVAVMLFATACSTPDNNNDDYENETEETSVNEKEEPNDTENKENEFEPWQNIYTYYGTPLDGIVKIFDYYSKSQQELNPYNIAPENEQYGDVYAFYISTPGMNINDIYGHITYTHSGDETFEFPRETNEIAGYDKEYTMTKDGSIYTYLETKYYSSGTVVTTIVFDAANNTIDVLVTANHGEVHPSPTHTQYVLKGNELFIIESRQVKGKIRNVIYYYDGTVCKFAVEETGAAGSPQVTIDITSASDISWDSMYASSSYTTYVGEYNNSTNEFTFTGN